MFVFSIYTHKHIIITKEKEAINLKESRGLGWDGPWEGLEGRKWEVEIIELF